LEWLKRNKLTKIMQMMSDCRMEESYYLLTTMTTYPMTKDKLLHELIYVI